MDYNYENCMLWIMNELLVYTIIGLLTFIIGLLFGYLATTAYYNRRFLVVAGECRDLDSIEPLLEELERES
jgi:hypothetical protein